MKQTRWIIPMAAIVIAACSEAGSSPIEPVRGAQFSATTAVSCSDEDACDVLVSGFVATTPRSDTSPPAPAPTRTLYLATNNGVVGVLATLKGLNVDQIGKTTMWTSSVSSDTSPPAPAPPQPGVSLAGRMGKTAFMTLLNAAMGVGPAPSDTSPPGPSPVGASWSDGRVMLLMSIPDMQKTGAIHTGTQYLHMQMELRSGGKSITRVFTSPAFLVTDSKTPLTGREDGGDVIPIFTHG